MAGVKLAVQIKDRDPHLEADRAAIAAQVDLPLQGLLVTGMLQNLQPHNCGQVPGVHYSQLQMAICLC